MRSLRSATAIGDPPRGRGRAGAFRAVPRRRGADAAAFRTPLGEVPLDQRRSTALGGLPQVKLADAPHEPEHALEVELPFLQAVLADFALVPLWSARRQPARLPKYWTGCGAGRRP